MELRPDVHVREAHSEDVFLRHWWLGELLSCHWCSSGWISLGLVGATWLVLPEGLPLPILIWFAVWGLGAMLADHFM